MKPTKVLKAVMALALIAGLSINVFANSKSKNSDDKKESIDKTSKMLKVRSDAETSVYVLNQEGKEVYSDNIPESYSASKIYDFSKLKNGVYTMITRTEQKSVERKIKIQSEGLEVLEVDEKYKPHFAVNEKYVMVNYLNLNEDNISILLESSRSEFYNEDIGNERAFEKKIDIRKLPRGEYQLILSAGENSHYYSFEK